MAWACHFCGGLAAGTMRVATGETRGSTSYDGLPWHTVYSKGTIYSDVPVCNSCVGKKKKEADEGTVLVGFSLLLFFGWTWLFLQGYMGFGLALGGLAASLVVAFVIYLFKSN